MASEALANFEKYLALEPTAPDRDVIEQKINTLGETDIAEIVYRLNWLDFSCDVRNWYHYTKHFYKELTNNITLSNAIRDLVIPYLEKIRHFFGAEMTRRIIHLT